MRAEARRRRERLEAVMRELGYVPWRPPRELGQLRGYVAQQRRRRAFVLLLLARSRALSTAA
ncbi:MAG TPA: hypothetical protein VEB22_11320 [Phycisphaerales bacterium]|nr:hypothetical protein [Phycisphaerales bacterium]